MGAKIHANVDIKNKTIAVHNGRLLPYLSLKGPKTSCPKAIPNTGGTVRMESQEQTMTGSLLSEEPEAMETRFLTLIMGMELIPGQEMEETGITETPNIGGTARTACQEPMMTGKSIPVVAGVQSTTLIMETELIPDQEPMEHGAQKKMKSG